MSRSAIGFIIAGVAVAGIQAQAFAHPGALDAASPREVSTEETTFGREGDPRNATRTVFVDMSDTMRFKPSRLTVKQGETIRFLVRNSGKAMHELVLGTMADLKAHAELMRKHPGMEHGEPYMVHVAPGRVRVVGAPTSSSR
jgi:uncharacterized cupredoxin-like copper-binding protein